MLCPNCETENAEDARFCKECGFPLSGSISRGAGAASPARSRRAYQQPAPSEPERREPAPQPGAERSSARYQSRQGTVSLESEIARQTPGFSWEDPFAQDAPEPKEPEPEPELVFVDEPDPEPAPAEAAPEPQPAFSAFSRYGTATGAERPQRAVTVPLDARTPHDEAASPAPAPRPEQPAYSVPEPPAEDPFAGETISFFSDYQPTDILEPIDEAAEAARLAPRSFRAPERERRFTGKQIALIVGGVAVVLAALVAVVGFALGFWGGVAVPNVVGMDQEQAQATLTEDGFAPKVLQVKSDEIEGRVLVMDPGAGSFAEEGSEVVIHVATARTIPEVVGEDVNQALAMLAEAGYENVKQQTQYTDEPEGLIMAVSPEAGTRAKSSMEVTITVAENYKVPDISGQSQEEASKTIEDAGLSPYVLYVDTDQYADGSVIGTDPAAGTKVTQGASVAISVARLRGVELTNLAQQALQVGQTVEIGGVSYQIESVDSVTYQGNDTVAFSITAKPFVTFFGETLFASSSQAVTGQIVYNDANEVVSIS